MPDFFSLGVASVRCLKLAMNKDVEDQQPERRVNVPVGIPNNTAQLRKKNFKRNDWL